MQVDTSHIEQGLHKINIQDNQRPPSNYRENNDQVDNNQYHSNQRLEAQNRGLYSRERNQNQQNSLNILGQQSHSVK